MSKIQDALAKLQATATRKDPSIKKHDPANSEKLAKVVSRKGKDNSSRHDSRVIKINRLALRRAGLLAPESQERDMADQYRLIKRPLLDNAVGKSAHESECPNLIMIASAMPGDGKTFTAINLALSMAIEKDTTVLLVDADVSKQHISYIFGISDQPGLIDAMKDEGSHSSEFVIDTDIPRLSILAAGTRDDFATELLASKRMADVARELSEIDRDRIVIFDSPPLLVTSEAPVLASLMGQIALVVKANVTPQDAVLEAIEKVDESKAVNLIFNEASKGFTSGYYGGYGYGNGYGRDKS